MFDILGGQPQARFSSPGLSGHRSLASGYLSKGSPQIKLLTQAGILCLFVFAHASYSPTWVLPTACHSLRTSPQGSPFHPSLTQSWVLASQIFLGTNK